MIDPNLVTTIRVGELPPNAFTLESKIPHEIGSDLNNATIQDLITFLQPYVGVFQYEEKTLIVNQAYIDANFDETGLGINICAGWAIRNGNNGTTNADGRVGIAYGETNNVIGQTGGSSTHLLTESQIPIHAHNNGVADDNASFSVYGKTTNGLPGLATLSIQSEETPRTYQGITSQIGGNQPHNNMQPYEIVLKIVKL